MDIKEAGREAGFGLSETILCILFEERAARFLGLADGTSVFNFQLVLILPYGCRRRCEAFSHLLCVLLGE